MGASPLPRAGHNAAAAFLDGCARLGQTAPMTPPPAALLFDLDGTLVDSAPDLCDSLNHVLASLGLGPIAEAAVRNMVGQGVMKLLERGLGAHGLGATTVPLQPLFDAFLTRYGQHIADRSRPWPGVVETLEALAAAGHPMAICTNKLEGLSRSLLRMLDLARFFPVVLGGDSLPYKKPDGRHLTDALSRLGCPPGTPAVMVGDSAADRDAAANAGVPVVLVSFGYTPVAAADLAPDALIDDFRALPAAIARVLDRAAVGA